MSFDQGTFDAITSIENRLRSDQKKEPPFYTVTTFPDRKLPGLYLVEGNVYTSVATFKSKKLADQFERNFITVDVKRVL